MKYEEVIVIVSLIFLQVVVERQPEFVAVHFQETGGKNYRDCSDSISIFFR